MLQNTVNSIAYQVLEGVQQLIEVDECTFTFNVSVLSQMSPSAWSLGSVWLSNAEDIA